MNGPLGFACRVASVVVAALVCSPAAGQATRPADGETSVPISLPSPELRDIKPVAQRIRLTDEEKVVLSSIKDRTGEFDETPLYVMLAVAARAPKLDAIEWDQLDRPAYVNLLTDPNRYRATPLRTKVQVYYVTKLQPGAGLNFSQFWPKDRPVWMMDCVPADTPMQKEKPLRVFSIQDPTSLIGEPARVGEHQRREYPRGPTVRVAGLFYKLYRTREEGSGKLRDYPQLVAWQLAQTIQSVPLGGFDFGQLAHMAPLAVIVIGLGALFYFTRKRLARLREQDRRDRPRPRPDRAARDRRSGAARQRKPRDGEDEEEDDEEIDGPVDPDLTAAVRQFRRERGLDDEDDSR